MPTEPSYTYTPIYGVEEYASLGVPSTSQTGGGAVVTNNNLLVSLWSGVSGPGTHPTQGSLIKPSYAFGGDWFSVVAGSFPAGRNIYDVPNVGWKSNKKSRYSTRFLLDAQMKADIGFPVMGFMNPPAELRQDLMDALSFDEDGNVVVNKPLLDHMTWSIRGVGADIDTNYSDFVTINAVFSGFSPNGLPYYSGDGSDGVFPTPLVNMADVYSGESAQALVSALDAGTFSVAFYILPQPVDSAVYTVEWPHSIGRG